MVWVGEFLGSWNSETFRNLGIHSDLWLGLVARTCGGWAITPVPNRELWRIITNGPRTWNVPRTGCPGDVRLRVGVGYVVVPFARATRWRTVTSMDRYTDGVTVHTEPVLADGCPATNIPMTAE